MSPGPDLRRGRCTVVVSAVLVLLLSACSALVDRSSVPDGPIAGQSIFDIEIPGTANGQLTTGTDGSVTKLYDVTGDWEQVSVELAGIVQDEGWTVASLNCVGSGNDVIARKLVDGQWLLLESGAGERGAGIIVRRAPQQSAPPSLSVSGRCPDALVRAVD